MVETATKQFDPLALAGHKHDGTVVDSWMLGPIRDGLVVVDVETDGLESHFGCRPFLIGIGTTDGQTAKVDFPFKSHKIGAEVERILLHPGLAKVGHNIKFDYKMLRAAGIKVRGPLLDTMLVAQIHNERMSGYGLKRLAVSVLGEKPDEEKAVKRWLIEERARRRKKAKAEGHGVFTEPTYKDLPRDMVDPYLEKDLEYTMRLLYALGPALTRRTNDTCQVEHKLLPVVASMEERGVAVNVRYFERMAEQARENTFALAKDCWKIAGGRFDVNSNKQLAQLMFGKFGLKCHKLTEKGSPCLDKDTLPTYDHPLAAKVLEYRGIKKLCSTYYEPLADLGSRGGGVIHTSINQNQAVTSRMSSSEPNLQNVPRRDRTVRRGFVCRKGFRNYYIDFEQIEMKLFAHHAKSVRLVELFAAGLDAHADTGVELFGVEAKDDDVLRNVAKTINFSILYGAGARKIRMQLRKRIMEETGGRNLGPMARKLMEMTESGTRALLRTYFQKRPEVRQYMDETIRSIRAKGFVEDAYGRPYHVPWQEAYKAMNYQVQGCAAGVLKRAMIRLNDALENRPEFKGTATRARLLLVVHDEFVVEVPVECNHELVCAGLLNAIEDRTTFMLPITADVSVSTTSWADKEKVKKGAA